MRLPKWLKVGPRSYALVVTPNLQEGDPPKACWGLYQSAEERIRVDADALGRPVILAETLLHEALHALDKHMRLGLSEQQVTALDVGLTALLVDNRVLRQAVEEAVAEHKRKTRGLA